MDRKTELELETVIGKWFDKFIESNDAPDVYYSEDIVARMTTSALLVLEQSIATGKYYNDNV